MMLRFIAGYFGGLALVVGGLVAVLYSMSGPYNIFIPGVLALICGVVLYEWGTSDRPPRNGRES